MYIGHGLSKGVFRGCLLHAHLEGTLLQVPEQGPSKTDKRAVVGLAHGPGDTDPKPPASEQERERERERECERERDRRRFVILFQLALVIVLLQWNSSCDLRDERARMHLRGLQVTICTLAGSTAAELPV